MVCYYFKKTFNTYIANQDIVSRMYKHAYDTNGDDDVTFEEYESIFIDYFTIFFNELDRNNDGSIDENLTNESIKEYSLEFFERLLIFYIEFYDFNGDQSISPEDFTFVIPQSMFQDIDKNEDGKVTIAELTGISLITFPAPIYTAYALLDEDQDEKFTMEEIIGFLRRTFTIIDTNGDCDINLEELIAALDESNLPEDFQLGAELIGQQYLTLAKYFVDGFIARADTNEDGKVTLEEIVEFSDFSFIDSSILVAMNYANRPIAEYLSGSQYGRHDSFPFSGHDVVAVWLATLKTFLDNPVYKSAPPTQCGAEGQ